MTSIYQAILQAADHIQRHPQEFNYSSTRIPQSVGCGAPGCALGWIGTFFGSLDGLKTGDYNGISLIASPFMSERDTKPMQVSQVEFYERMENLCGSSAWEKSGRACAATLRLYAAKYHAPAEPVSDPAFTRFKALLAQDQPQRERESV